MSINIKNIKITKKPRYYVVVNRDQTWQLIKSINTPGNSDCENYFGPFKTKRAALFMATQGVADPACQSVNDAEKLSKRWSFADQVMAELLYNALMVDQMVGIGGCDVKAA